MPLVGIIAKKKDVMAIKKELGENNLDFIEITKQSIENIRNIKFEEIIFLEDIKLEQEEYKYMNEIISNSKYLILNGDIEISILKGINIEKPIKSITFGFNSKATITISSIKDEKIIICLQRDIEKIDGEVIETQEKEIRIKDNESVKVHNKLVVFIINELHNFKKQ